MIVAVVAATLFAAILASAATPEPNPSPGIAPVDWELVALPASGGSEPPIAAADRYTVQFLPSGQIDIGADCHRLSGEYAIQGARIAVTLDASALPLCDPGSQAEAFLSSLKSAESFAYDADGVLILRAAAGDLRFRPSLVGVVWAWHDFRGGNDVVFAPEHPERYTIEFLPGDKLAIKADCNRAKGSYIVDGAAITLTTTGVTRAMCAPGSLSRTFLRDLVSSTSHVFRDGALYLALPVDAGILSFEARYPLPASATPEAG